MNVGCAMRKLRAMRVEVGRGPARRDTWSAENNLPLPYASGRAGNIGAWIPSERPVHNSPPLRSPSLSRERLYFPHPRDAGPADQVP